MFDVKPGPVEGPTCLMLSLALSRDQHVFVLSLDASSCFLLCMCSYIAGRCYLTSVTVKLGFN